MRSWCATDSSKRNSSSGTRRRRSRAADLAAEERRRALERLARSSARSAASPSDRVVDARQLQVGGDLDARERDEADARIVHLAREQLAELLADLFADAFGRGGVMSHRMSGTVDGDCRIGICIVTPSTRCRATRSIAKTSMTSPTLTSLKLSRPMPHSKPGLHLGHVVLEAAQRRDLALADDDVVAQQARLRVARRA